MPSVPTSSPTARPKLLLVDDIAANLLALEAVLENQGYDLVQVTSGAAAIAAVEQDDFAVILLDVNMPAMSGIEAARRIKALPRGRDVSIVYVTAVSHDAERVRDAYNTGAVDFIAKPIDRDVLRAKVRALTDLHQARADQRAEADRLAGSLDTAGQLNEEFVASLGRELRGPLQTIIAWTRALKSGTMQESQRAHALDVVERTADAQLELIQEMMDINSLATGTLALHPTKLDLGKRVEDTVTTLRPQAIADGVRLELAIAPDLPQITADPDRVDQIVRQLVTFGPARDAARRTGGRDAGPFRRAHPARRPGLRRGNRARRGGADLRRPRRALRPRAPARHGAKVVDPAPRRRAARRDDRRAQRRSGQGQPVRGRAADAMSEVADPSVPAPGAPCRVVVSTCTANASWLSPRMPRQCFKSAPNTDRRVFIASGP